MPELIVESPPVAKARPRVTMAGGKARAYTPAKTKHAEWIIRQAWLEKFGSTPHPFTGPVFMTVQVWLPMPKSIPKRDCSTARPMRRPDLENFTKTALDALNGVAYLDDAQVVTLIAEKRYLVPSEPGAGRWEIHVDEIISATYAPTVQFGSSPSRHQSQPAAALGDPAHADTASPLLR